MFLVKIKHCNLYVHFSLFVALAAVSLFTGIKNGGEILFSIFLHEVGHLASMVHVKAPIKDIHLSAMGLRVTMLGSKQIEYKKSAIISLAGPLMNLFVGLLAYLIGWSAGVTINLVLGFFHLLPIEPLDGGLALKARLSMIMPQDKAEKIVTIISFVFLLPVAILGFLLLLHTRYNFSLFALSIFILFYLVFRRGSLDG